VLQAVGMVSET